MPLVLINPEVKPVGEPVTGPEGCLSFPEIYADITRPDVVDVKALNLEGKPIEFRCGGLLARAVQHETDHLHGILFIDRMDKKTKADLRPNWKPHGRNQGGAEGITCSSWRMSRRERMAASVNRGSTSPDSQDARPP